MLMLGEILFNNVGPPKKKYYKTRPMIGGIKAKWKNFQI